MYMYCFLLQIFMFQLSSTSIIYKIMMHYLNLMLLKLCVGAVVVMIVWQLNLQLPMQSVPITTDYIFAKTWQLFAPLVES
jgi:hypothetical protein